MHDNQAIFKCGEQTFLAQTKKKVKCWVLCYRGEALKDISTCVEMS